MLDFLVKAPNKMALLLEKLKKVSEPLYLFGAGNCGEHYLHVLGENGISVEAFLDDDPKKQKMGFHGKSVFSPEMMEGCAVTILISSYGPNTLKKRLEGISPALLKRVLWSEFFLWEDGLDYYSYYMKHTTELEQVYGLLADERSKEVFRNLLNYKVSRDISLVTSINDLGCCDQYFDRSIVNFGQGEVFADLGAYIGDTVDSFVKHIRKSGASYDHIYAFEPDPDNFAELQRRTAQYPNISYINKGAYSENTILHFSAEGTWTSFLDDRGDIEVSVCALDEEIGDRVTFMKADIEGAEMQAIKGAESMIREYKPTIAFSVYHKKEDIFAIPLRLHELNQGYKFYMRHYGDIPIDSIVYAIDSNRA